MTLIIQWTCRLWLKEGGQDRRRANLSVNWHLLATCDCKRAGCLEKVHDDGPLSVGRRSLSRYDWCGFKRRICAHGLDDGGAHRISSITKCHMSHVTRPHCKRPAQDVANWHYFWQRRNVLSGTIGPSNPLSAWVAAQNALDMLWFDGLLISVDNVCGVSADMVCAHANPCKAKSAGTVQENAADGVPGYQVGNKQPCNSPRLVLRSHRIAAAALAEDSDLAHSPSGSEMSVDGVRSAPACLLWPSFISSICTLWRPCFAGTEAWFMLPSSFASQRNSFQCRPQWGP